MVQLGVQHNFIWKWIGVTCHNWGDMVFLFVDSGHNLEGCFPQHLLHSFADFDALYAALVSDWPTWMSELRHILPDSVLGTAIVILIVQVSQHTCSSFFPPNHRPDFLLFFSKKCTATRPRTPPLDDEERCCCINVLMRESM